MPPSPMFGARGSKSIANAWPCPAPAQGASEPGVADSPVVAFDVGVLLRLTRLDVLDADALLLP